LIRETMKKKVPLLSSLVVILCFAASAMGQAGAPTQRVHIPGIPDGTSIYPKSPNNGDRFTSIGCVTKSDSGEITVVDWRGAAEQSVAGAPTSAARPPLVLRLQGDPEMLNFQVGHEVEVAGPIVDMGGTKPPEIKVESLLYLSRTCWIRGTNTPAPAKSKP
jgi:hypothetical protein